MSEGNRGAAVGLSAAIGLGGLSLADDVVRAGARGLGSVSDDVVRTGTRLGTNAGTELGGSILDDAGRVGSRKIVDPHAPRGASTRMPVAAVEEGELGTQLAEIGVDVALEFVEFPADLELSPPPVYIEATTYPRFFDLTAEPEGWTRVFGDEGEGDGAPLVFVAEALGDDQLRFGGQPHALVELGAQCWAQGTTCVFVACPARQLGSCVSSSRARFIVTRGQGHERVSDFVADFSHGRMDRVPRPRYVASAGGSDQRSVERLRPKPEPAPQ